MSYWDTSALAKLYIPEGNSAAYEQYATSAATCIISELGIFEMQRVALRKESEGLIKPAMADAIMEELLSDISAGHIRIIEIGTTVKTEFRSIMASCYRRPSPILLRTLDAIHLASARVAGQTEFVAADQRLRDAAKALGLLLIPA
jgi:predicted nucleic acid-binding protein